MRMFMLLAMTFAASCRPPEDPYANSASSSTTKTIDGTAEQIGPIDGNIFLTTGASFKPSELNGFTEAQYKGTKSCHDQGFSFNINLKLENPAHAGTTADTRCTKDIRLVPVPAELSFVDAALKRHTSKQQIQANALDQITKKIIANVEAQPRQPGDTGPFEIYGVYEIIRCENAKPRVSYCSGISPTPNGFDYVGVVFIVKKQGAMPGSADFKPKTYPYYFTISKTNPTK
jgi:hypothetical protein